MLSRLFVCILCVLFAMQPTNLQYAQTIASRAKISADNIDKLKPILKLGQKYLTNWDVIWSPNGKQVAVITRIDATYRGGQVRLFNSDLSQASSDPLLIDNHDELKCAAFSPDSAVIATCGANGDVELKSTANGQSIKTFSMSRPRVTAALAFNPTGTLLAIGRWNEGIQLWDVASGKRQRTINAELVVIHNIAFSPDGKLIAAINNKHVGHSVLLWDVQSGELKATLSTENDTGRETKKIMFSKDGKFLVSCDEWSGNTFVWDVSTYKQLAFLEDAWGVAVSPTENMIAYAHSRFGDGALWIPWHITLRNLVTDEERTLLRGPRSIIMAMAFNPNGDQLVFAEQDGSVKIANVKDATVKILVQGIHSSIDSITFGADSKSFVSTGYLDGTARLWDAYTGKGIGIWSCCITNVTAVALSSDRKSWAYSMFEDYVYLTDHFIHLIETTTGRERAPLEHRNENYDQYIFNILFSYDGKLLASAGVSGDIFLWDVETARLLGKLEGHTSTVNQLIFSADNSLLLSVSKDGTVRSWNVKQRKELVNFKSPTDLYIDNVAALNARGDIAASTNIEELGDKTIHLWNTHTGKSLIDIKGETRFLNDIAFNSDGTLLATLSGERTLKIWDSQTGTLIRTTGELNYPTALAFSPNGELLVTAQSEAIWIWAIEP